MLRIVGFVIVCVFVALLNNTLPFVKPWTHDDHAFQLIFPWKQIVIKRLPEIVFKGSDAKLGAPKNVDGGESGQRRGYCILIACGLPTVCFLGGGRLHC